MFYSCSMKDHNSEFFLIFTVNLLALSHILCVMYVSFGSKVRPRTFGCVAMRSAVLFIFMSILLLYSAGSGVNRVQVVLSRFIVRLFCFVQAKTLCKYGCMYLVVLVCVEVMVMFHKAAFCHPQLFGIYTSDTPAPQAPVRRTASPWYKHTTTLT